jgi:hypothetical protein
MERVQVGYHTVFGLGIILRSGRGVGKMQRHLFPQHGRNEVFLLGGAIPS